MVDSQWLHKPDRYWLQDYGCLGSQQQQDRKHGKTLNNGAKTPGAQIFAHEVVENQQIVRVLFQEEVEE